MTAGRLLWDKKNIEASEGSNTGKFDTLIVAAHRAGRVIR
jgi:hypothetical protein